MRDVITCTKEVSIAIFNFAEQALKNEEVIRVQVPRFQEFVSRDLEDEAREDS
jgi:hypothetical protein